jgi:hypothetical protein
MKRNKFRTPTSRGVRNLFRPLTQNKFRTPTSRGAVFA